MTRMTRSDQTGPELVEVGELFIEKGKRMGDFGFGERTRPRMGKESLKQVWEKYKSQPQLHN